MVPCPPLRASGAAGLAWAPSGEWRGHRGEKGTHVHRCITPVIDVPLPLPVPSGRSKLQPRGATDTKEEAFFPNAPHRRYCYSFFGYCVIISELGTHPAITNSDVVFHPERRLQMKSILTAAVLILSAALLTSSAYADQSQWAKNHPRRHQVNKRLNNQNKRIKNEVKEGEITKGQAKNLHRHDKAIRQEERDMSKQNGGHITKGEQKVLNQQENGTSREIGK